MKKTVRILSLTLAVLMLAATALTLASCSTKLSGTYEGKADLFGFAGASVSYEFSGSKVTVTVTGSVLGFEKSETKKGTYEIKDKDDGTQTITFTYDGESSSDTVPFSQDKDAKTITIGGITYNKK